MTKVEFLKRVSLVDPKAAKELDRIVTKAAHYPKYAESIMFSAARFGYPTAAKVLTWLFDWDHTGKGRAYWEQLFSKLEVADL